MGTVFKVQEAPTVNVTGTGDSFPVHRIYCVGQNYANHVREMGANLERFSCKPCCCVWDIEDDSFAGALRPLFPLICRAPKKLLLISISPEKGDWVSW